MVRRCLTVALVVFGCARAQDGEVTERPLHQSGGSGGAGGASDADSGAAGVDADGGATGGKGAMTGGATGTGGGTGGGATGGATTGGGGTGSAGTGGASTGGASTGGASSGGTGGGVCVPAPVGCTPKTSLFRNPSFEEPVITGTVQQVATNGVPGWSTSGTSIEVWRSTSIAPQDGAQHVEVSAFTRDTLSQQITTIPHSKLSWRFYHRGRAAQDTLELHIGAPGNLTLQRSVTTGLTWTPYNGTYDVPAGQTVTRFEFRAIIPNSGSGNHLDAADAAQVCPGDANNDGCVDNPD